MIIPKSYEKDFTIEAAVNHLVSIEPRFAEIAAKYPCEVFSQHTLETPVNPFDALATSILAQQISGSAARSIKKRFLQLFSGDEKLPDSHPASDSNSLNEQIMKGVFPTPYEVLQLDIPTLRSAGLSLRKAEYMLDLAAKFSTGEINAHDLITLPDDEVIEMLVKVRGLGIWSAQIFLMFALKRQDVFPIGDLGLQRGMAIWFGKNISLAKGSKGKFKYMSEEEMIEKSDPYKPYRTLFTWYMWRATQTILPI
ncbi:DNA glycosylase [Limtongia smithiae]|uniref:DNA glycosylase n=1 Tax=Limtongia smithiae TaxID=1125753 RepID=UPI0034CD11A2